MANPDLIMTLGKVIIAAAWADGEVTNEEVNSLKDLLFHLPNLKARQWAELDMYIETPVGEAERQRLLDELETAIRSDDDKRLALEALNDMVSTDGEVTDEEKAVVQEIQQAVEEADTGLIGAFSRLVKGSVQRRSTAARNAPNREKYLHDFMNNKVYYGVRHRLDMNEVELDLPEATLRKLSMVGGLMGQVARTNDNVSHEELDVIVNALQADWHLDRDQAAFVASIAVDKTADMMDQYRLAREFVDMCTHEELEAFLDVLFRVAAADGMVTRDEIEEIRMISRSLLLSHEQFINAKLKIPREKRQV
jgi:uncharacterized tellurite resistance protein B-like protein